MGKQAIKRKMVQKVKEKVKCLREKKYGNKTERRERKKEWKNKSEGIKDEKDGNIKEKGEMDRKKEGNN